MNTQKTTKTVVIIDELNASISGWANYYKHVVSKKIFCNLDNEFWKMIWKWAKRRHTKKSKLCVKNKYFQYGS